MNDERRHRAFLDFVSKITSLASQYSIRDLQEFRYRSSNEWPDVAKVIETLSEMAERTETVVPYRSAKRVKTRTSNSSDSEEHLFDLLRSKKLFPKNSDLADFASRILPSLESRRFDKLSRGDIAARVVEHVEAVDPRRRDSLERSMRDALQVTANERKQNKESFFSTWEAIIRGGRR